MCEAWTPAELALLRFLLPTSSIDLIEAALAPRSRAAIFKQATRLGLREPAPRQHKDWRTICNNHKPRIVLATAFPIEQQGGK
jgi:hypothetical protein